MSDARWGDPRDYAERDHGDERPRVYDERDRDDHDPRDGLMRDLDLPRGEERELVVDRGRVYELNGEDTCAEATSQRHRYSRWHVQKPRISSTWHGCTFVAGTHGCF
jgi:hypothetical protein